jgi:hypothetical protein
LTVRVRVRVMVSVKVRVGVRVRVKARVGVRVRVSVTRGTCSLSCASAGGSPSRTHRCVVASAGEDGGREGAASMAGDPGSWMNCEHGAQAVSRRSQEGKLGAVGSRGRG